MNFEWHDFAKIWQTPGEGEQFYADSSSRCRADERGACSSCSASRTTPRSRSGEPLDQTMADCILALYRSAVDVGKEWAPDFHDIATPGLDPRPVGRRVPVGRPEPEQRASARARRSTELDGLGHWWMLQDPERGAAVLEEFWASAG